MPAPIDKATQNHYIQLRQWGFSKSRAAREAKVSRTWAHQFERNNPIEGGGHQRQLALDKDDLPKPKRWDDLELKAKASLNDFNQFRERYFARHQIPWADDVAKTLVRHLEDDAEKSYIVLNCPPGSGKTTLASHDAPCWLICRDRRIRILLGSHTMQIAKQFTRRLKLSLERPTPFHDADRDVEAEAILIQDYGRFKPDHTDLWRTDEYVVDQIGGVAPGEKEPTVMAAAEDSGFLGGRFEVSIWDDLVTPKNQRNAISRENQREFWRKQAETRCEPGGVVVLLGQRINADDLYRFCLDMKIPTDMVEKVDGQEDPRKYHQVVYPAHFDHLCKGEHDRDKAKPWPKGCLLDPYRLPWRDLAVIKENDPGEYETVYQQRDADPESVLVQEHWIEGGEHNGIHYPGCKEPDLTVGQWIPGAPKPNVSAVTVDPSPEAYWSVQWYLYSEEIDTRVLADHANRKMRAPQFLDKLNDGSYVGLFKDWVDRAKRLGFPITHLIVEQNAAQRFMVQYEYFQTFLRHHGILLLPHDTTSNKADPEYGVWALLPNLYRLGKVRLPYHDFGRKASSALLKEIRKWPDSPTEDCVMAQWFFEFNLPRLKLTGKAAPKRKMPTWVGS